MKKIVTTLAIAAFTLLPMNAEYRELKSYIDNMCNMHDYAGRANYSVLLPQAEDPVEYLIDMQSTATADDNLSPCRYLISWKRNAADAEDIDGFTAYFDGSHYRYRDNRLQEYHMQWDSIPFQIRGGGVQGSAQFVDVLPQFSGRELSRMLEDTCFNYVFTPDTLYQGKSVSTLKGKLSYQGITGKEVTFVFDPQSGMPSFIEYENNPGAISEQTVTITYSDTESKPFPIATEEDLMNIYPEVFERFRESNFRAENLPGTPLPTFSAPTLDGKRYTYHRGESLDRNTVIIVIDDAISDPAKTLDAVNKAHATSPVDFDILVAFVSNHADKAEEICGNNKDANVVIGARSLARDCGINLYPTILYVSPDGTVKDITLGYNKDLTNVVIQKMMIMK